MLFGEAQLESRAAAPETGLFETTAVWLVIALTVLNALSVFLLCGFGWCPDNPVGYELIQGAP